MFSTLLQLPLFQGLSQEDFTNILGKVKLHFSKHKAGETIIKANDRCHELVFLLQGELAATTVSDDKSFSFVEIFYSSSLLEPHSLFGLEARYRSTYTAHTDANTVSVDKSYIMKELFKYEIFRINYVNNICNKLQTFYKRNWYIAPESIEDKIIYFVLRLADRPEGEKILKIKMEDLARYVDDTRLNVSRALNDMQEANLLQLNRKEIIIPDGMRLLQWMIAKKSTIDNQLTQE